MSIPDYSVNIVLTKDLKTKANYYLHRLIMIKTNMLLVLPTFPLHLLLSLTQPLYSTNVFLGTLKDGMVQPSEKQNSPNGFTATV